MYLLFFDHVSSGYYLTSKEYGISYGVTASFTHTHTQHVEQQDRDFSIE